MQFQDRVRGVRGEVTLFTRRPGQPDIVLGVKHNVVLNSGMDLLAQAVAGSLFVDGMYMAFDNGAIASWATPPVTWTAQQFQAAAVDPKGLVRVSTLANPSFTTTDATSYVNNVATFVAITDSNEVIAGSAAVIDGTSKFYGAGLVSFATDLEDDLLLSAVSFKDLGAGAAPTITKLAGAQLGIRWNIYFEL